MFLIYSFWVIYFCADGTSNWFGVISLPCINLTQTYINTNKYKIFLKLSPLAHINVQLNLMDFFSSRPLSVTIMSFPTADTIFSVHCPAVWDWTKGRLLCLNTNLYSSRRCWNFISSWAPMCNSQRGGLAARTHTHTHTHTRQSDN